MKKSSLILVAIFISTSVTPIIANTNISDYLPDSKSKKAAPRWFGIGIRGSSNYVNDFINGGIDGTFGGLEFYTKFVTRFGLGIQFALGGPDHNVGKYSYELEYGYLGIALQYHLYHGHLISPYIGIGSVSHKESIGYTSQITNVGGVNYRNIGCNIFADKIIQLNFDIKFYSNPSYRYPLEVGADRIATAIAATKFYPEDNIIVVDFGTATTFCVISRQRKYLGGIIVPGIQISLEALAQKTAKLHSVEIVAGGKVVGRTTAESIQSGLYYGQIGIVREITQCVTAETFFNQKPIIIGTGGFSSLFADCGLFDTILPDLVLYGLYHAQRMNHGNENSARITNSNN